MLKNTKTPACGPHRGEHHGGVEQGSVSPIAYFLFAIASPRRIVFLPCTYQSDMYVNEAVSDCIRICVGVTHRIVSVENQC